MRPPPLATQRRILKAAIALLVAAALITATCLTRVPLPFRLLLAAGDLVAAGVLLVLYRQKFPRR